MAEPRWATPKTPSRQSFGPAIAAVAERLGTPLMPWQQLVAEVGGEIDSDTGLPAYRAVVITVPRQSGKTTLVLSWQVQRAIGWGKAQRIVYSAQTGNDARKKLIEDQIPLLEPRKKLLGISSILKGMGNEAVVWHGGSRLVLLASSEDSGHGKTVDLGVKDELFADTDLRRDQALVPAMSTRADAQALTTSTAGTDASIALNQEVERGRASVDAGMRSGIAYFEWSADTDDDPDDPDVWWRVMPALGFTVTEDTIRHARLILPDSEFRRAFLNIPTKSDERVIPAAAWDLVCGADEVQPAGRLTFGFDVDAEQSHAAIIAIDDSKSVEVVDSRPGTQWLAERMTELDTRYGYPEWAHDGSKSAPVASILPELNVRHLHPVASMPAACGAFYNAVADCKFRVRRHPALDAAVAGAGRRMVGDGWLWMRRGTVAISPLVASTVALWAANETVAPVGFKSLDDFLDDEG